MKFKTILLLIFFITNIHSLPGDIIRTFTLEGQPKYGINGLEYDPADGNIWACGNEDIGSVFFCKFKNDNTHALIQNWQSLKDMLLVRDIAYPFYYTGMDALAVLEDGYKCYVSNQFHPMPVKMFNKDNGDYLGVLSKYPFDGGFAYGLSVNYDKKTLYVTSDIVNYIERWNGTSFERFADCDVEAMGCAYAWGYIFVIHSSPIFQIWVISASDGSLVDKIALRNWDYYEIWGLSRGRCDVAGKNESLYVACENTVNYVIREIEIGDYNTGVETTSVGNIKAIFR
ncbi:MAG: hypothetical protein ACUVWP_01025 [bacterium]